MYDFCKIDDLTSEQIREHQEALISGAVARAARSPFYKARLAEAGIRAEDVTTLDDFRRVPFLTKEEMRRWMPYGFLAVDRGDVVRMHYSSGTTGIATAVYHTAGDVRRWSECVARGMIRVGVTREDVFQNMMGYGLFTGGLGFHYAAEMVGCMTIPASAGNTVRQIHLMQTFGTTVLHILPSYALRIAAHCREQGIDPANDLKLRIVFVGGEPHTDNVRQRIEDELGVKVYNNYGLSEMCGPGVAMECAAQNGLHLREDQYLVEIINPDTLEPAGPGEMGEMVLTSLAREAMPLLRYRTRDLTHFVEGACPCGNQHRRIARILGRSDDMLIVKGCNIYPMQIERVLLNIAQVGSNYVIVLESTEDVDDMTVKVELAAGVFYDDLREVEVLRKHLAQALKSEILVTPKVEILPHNALPAGEGKAQRVIDNRVKIEDQP